MGFRKVDFNNCVGSLNVLLDDRVVLQGQLVRDCDDNNNRKPDNVQCDVDVTEDEEFITLRLTCDALIIQDNNAHLRAIDPPLYAAGDLVRVNVAEIVSVGPSHGCPDGVVVA